jgi:hypothetical protein
LEISWEKMRLMVVEAQGLYEVKLHHGKVS